MQNAPSHESFKFRHVLVATDFEAASARTLEYATELATRLGAELTVMHAWEVPRSAYAPEFYAANDVAGLVADAAAHQLEQTAGILRQRMPFAKSLLRSGDPAQTIAKSAEEIGADVVVVGRNNGRIEHMLLGSVSERLIRICRMPVIVIPHPSGTA